MNMGDKIFSYSLIFSLCAHAGLIVYLSINKIKLSQKIEKPIEVTYQQIKQKEAVVREAPKPQLKVVDNKDFAKDVEILDKDFDLSSPILKDIRDISKDTDKIQLDKKQIPKIHTADLTRQITVPVLKSEKITNPKYLSYNQSIRQKIKERAYSYIDHPDFKQGSVYLTFVLRSDGTLKDLQIREERTKANSYLREISVRSIRESNPFSKFPQDLNYPELTFNVVISFEVSN